jgi:hypothetical protein
MAWVIAGPYPPTADPAAARTLAFARDRLRDGDEVVVISPVPTAAHRHEHLLGARGLRTVRRASRGADGVYLTLQPHIGLTPGAGRERAVAEHVLLARVLRSVPRSVLDVDDAAALSGGRAGRMVLDAAGELVVNDEGTRDRLVSTGAEPTKIRLVTNSTRRSWQRRGVDSDPAATPPAPSSAAVDPPIVPPDADSGAIERLIRERAVALPPQTMSPTPDRVDPAAALRALPVLALPVPPQTAKGRVARLVSRFTTWQLRPVVEHVNRLQRSVIEALGELGSAIPGESQRPRPTSGEDRRANDA